MLIEKKKKNPTEPLHLDEFTAKGLLSAKSVPEWKNNNYNLS